MKGRMGVLDNMGGGKKKRKNGKLNMTVSWK